MKEKIFQEGGALNVFGKILILRVKNLSQQSLMIYMV